MRSAEFNGPRSDNWVDNPILMKGVHDTISDMMVHGLLEEGYFMGHNFQKHLGLNMYKPCEGHHNWEITLVIVAGDEGHSIYVFNRRDLLAIIPWNRNGQVILYLFLTANTIPFIKVGYYFELNAEIELAPTQRRWHMWGSSSIRKAYTFAVPRIVTSGGPIKIQSTELVVKVDDIDAAHGPFLEELFELCDSMSNDNAEFLKGSKPERVYRTRGVNGGLPDVFVEWLIPILWR